MTTDKRKKTHNHNDDSITGTMSINAGQREQSSVGIDVDYYQNIIDDSDIPEDRKRELIEIIGTIVIQFIDLGFGVHPVQLAQDEKTNKKKGA